jgi:para-aminobenzoate synthetase/4-amino-4-deoxychorismate lyase
VAIRTVVVEKASGMAEYGVGGGVVWDSTVEGEYEEALLKTRVLSEQRPEYGPDFALLESLLWAPQAGYTLLDEHLDRLRQAAVYFRLRIDINAVFEHLMALAASLPTLPAGVQAVGGQGYKVRLLVYRDGRVQVEAAPLASPPVPGRVNAGGNESGKQMGVRVALARQPVDPSNPFLYHKTTVREVYERAQRDHPQADDVLLWNPAGELTESCTSNLVALLDGRLATPPVACGLLPGVLRGVLVGRGEIEERSIRVADLARCERLWLINSVRGWREMEVIPYEVNDSAKA